MWYCQNILSLYADDSGILVARKTKYEIGLILSSETNVLKEWLICNKLSLNFGKPESVLFGSKKGSILQI